MDSIIELVKGGGGLGSSERSGHADFFPNGGEDQPDCKNGIITNIGKEKDLYEGNIIAVVIMAIIITVFINAVIIITVIINAVIIMPIIFNAVIIITVIIITVIITTVIINAVIIITVIIISRSHDFSLLG